MATTTFDISEGISDEQKAAEAAALEQGEKLAQIEQEDQARKYEQIDAENGLIAGKFKSQEDLVKAYEELQKKMSSGEPVEESSEEVEEPATEEPVEEVPATTAALTKAAEEYENGQLSDETIEALSQMDSKELIKSYIEFYSQNQQQTQAAQIVEADSQAIVASVGGQEAYQSMVGWAAENLDASEIEAYNSVTNSGNTAAIKFAVEALSNRYKNAEGYEAPLVTGKRSAPKVQGYRSNAELSRDIADPRYQTDPAFRQDVENKLARSPDLL